MAAVPLAQRTQSAASVPDTSAAAGAAAAPASSATARQARDRDNQRARGDRNDTRNSASDDSSTRARKDTHNSAPDDARNGARVATGDAHRPHASAPGSETDDEEIIIVRPARRPRMDIDGGPGANFDDQDAPPPRWRRHADEDDDE
jgi:hypothetical protein